MFLPYGRYHSFDSNRDHSFSMYVRTQNCPENLLPGTCTRTCVYHGVRKVNFPEYFTYVPNE